MGPWESYVQLIVKVLDLCFASRIHQTAFSFEKGTSGNINCRKVFLFCSFVSHCAFALWWDWNHSISSFTAVTSHPDANEHFETWPQKEVSPETGKPRSRGFTAWNETPAFMPLADPTSILSKSCFLFTLVDENKRGWGDGQVNSNGVGQFFDRKTPKCGQFKFRSQSTKKTCMCPFSWEIALFQRTNRSP